MSVEENVGTSEELVEQQGGRRSPKRTALPGNVPTTVYADKKRKLPTWLFVGLGIFVGIIAGVLGMWHHEHTKPFLFVNNQVISQDEFINQLQAQSGNQTIVLMITNTLKEQFLKKENFWPTQAEIDSQIAKLEKANPKLLTALADQHVTMSDFQEGQAIKLGINNMYTSGVTVTPQEVQNFYSQESNPQNPNAQFFTPENVAVQVIACADKKTLTEAQSALAKGVDFATVAQQYSKDTSKANGGVIPRVVRGQFNNKVFPGLNAAMFKIPVGATSVIKSGPAWWIIKCLKHVPETILPFSQVSSICQQAALSIKGQRLNGQKVNQEYKQFVVASHIAPVEGAYAPAVQQVMSSAQSGS